jgi:hypothetical protein
MCQPRATNPAAENTAMRYTRIEVRGEQNGCTAVLSREPHAKYIEINLVTPAFAREHRLRADDADARRVMAQTVQHALDGFRGAGGDIREYAAALEHLAT